MVDTRRLEKLMSSAEPATAGDRTGREPVQGRRALALSGHREMRRAGQGRARSAQRQAVIDANWEALARCQPEAATDKAMQQFNAMALKSDIVSRFDLLRTQLVQRFRNRDMVTLGITGPNSGTGASFAAAGLVAALARRGDLRVIGMDLNLRAPALHRYFEIASDQPVQDLLCGDVPPQAHLRRLAATVALAPGVAVPGEPTSVVTEELITTFAELSDAYAPDLIICDLPPLLQGDTALEICSHLDAVLITADSRRTRADEVIACERLLSGQTEFLGVILNNYTGADPV